jgi:NADH-quinone oxidoreductase subunit N
VNFQSLIDLLITDTLETSLPLFRPELILCASIVLMLLVRIVLGGEKVPPFLLALLGSVVALWSALPSDGMNSWAQLEPCELFTGMLVHDTLSAFIRIFLLAFLVLFVILSRLTGIADRGEGQDYYTLVFGATLGMCLMASANHLIIVFLGIEMASVPSYVLAGIVQGRRSSSEAALKYAIYGAGTAGVMLYGISLLAGVLGSAHLPTMAQRLAELDLPAMLAASATMEGEQTRHPGDRELPGSGQSVSGNPGPHGNKNPAKKEPLTLMVLALGGLMLGAGIAFKLSAVPFHFWCPDVFEGASAEVDAFLSVASITAALVLLLRIGLGLGTLPGTVSFFVVLVGLGSVVTCTFGNLAAYGQTNIKRMLAYSTIAHAGYMMMAVAAAVALVGRDPLRMRVAVQSLLLYASIFFFMNLGAFSCVAFLRNAMGSEEIKDYAGLIHCCPVMTVSMVAILFSLVGLPPLAGFIGKFRIFQALFEAGGPLMMFLLVVAGLNTAISLVYYLRVAKTMCIDPEPNTRGPVSLRFLPVAYTLLVSFPVLLFGVLPGWLVDWAYQATANLF